MPNENSISGLRRILLEWSDIPLRGVLAATFICHGYPKLFGGLAGFQANLAAMGVPAPGLMAVLAALAEFGGGLAIALGLFTRLTSLSLVVVMGVAIGLVHGPQGFAMHVVNGKMQGFEWQLALLSMSLCLLLRGAGPLSIDRIISGYWSGRRQQKLGEQQA